MTTPRESSLRDQLRGASDILVLTGSGASPGTVEALGLPACEVRDLCDEVPGPRERDALVLAVSDLVSLRRAMTGIANFGTARTVVVWVTRKVARLPSVRVRPEWPPLEHLVVSRAEEQFVLLTFESVVPARPVLLEIARGATPSRALGDSWPVLGVRRDQPWRWPVADPSARVATLPRLWRMPTDTPPDLVLVEPGSAPGAQPPDLEDHPVLGRPVSVVVEEAPPSWEQLARQSSGDTVDLLAAQGRLSLGAVDEQLINPVGWERDALGEAVPLVAEGDDTLSASTGPGSPAVRLDATHGVSEADLASLRRLPGLRLGWSGGRGPHDYCRVVAGLAAAGVPLVSEQVPGWARALLAPDLTETLGRPADLSDCLRREEHSVLQRRAALRSHATRPWRRLLAAHHGLQLAPGPTVSVLLATRRPDMVTRALDQMARQRGVDVDVVLATHGFEAPQATLDAFREGSAVPLTAVHVDGSVAFGEVLNRAAAHATGDLVLKVDDDDWYGPDFIADLVLAQEYSGAEVVGCSAEFTFLHPLWLTTRRDTPSEVFLPFVAGGTLLVDRGALRSLGGFRRTVKYVDANLLAAVTAAGGSVYRTHGLGYVLRRGTAGHTWDPGLGYFLSAERAASQWRGFRPSLLLEARPEDQPTVSATSIEGP